MLDLLIDKVEEIGMLAEQLNIGQAAALYGVSLRTLRFYEDRGLLAPVRQGTARFYTRKDRVRIELILKGRRLGFTLSEIEKLILGAQGATSGEAEVNIADRLDRERILEQIAFLEAKRETVVSAIDELKSALHP